MNSYQINIAKLLFDTNAFRVSPANAPFWYTSGKLGPYYINTHYLAGGKESAEEILNIMDSWDKSRNELILFLNDLFYEKYCQDEIYKTVIDNMTSHLKFNFDISKISYISGGERRDWFFSLIISKLLDLPHISIFKDCETLILHKDEILDKNIIVENCKTLHIADLITEASSYVKTWIPAISALGCKIHASLCVVDRMQGGAEVLSRHGIDSLSLINIDKKFFDMAYELGLINSQQLTMLCNYFDDPFNTMKTFIEKNPEFIRQTIAQGGKNAQRARICIEQNIYGV